jgi:type IV pilus biogenesis protein CpaD/CtpE
MSLGRNAARFEHSVILLKSDSKMTVSMKLALILVIFADDFDTGDTSAWSNMVPQGSPKPRDSRSVFTSDRETLAAAVTPETRAFSVVQSRCD